MKKILMIENDQSFERLIKYKLIQAGYYVINITDGQEGLKAINEEKPALVLLNILLPSMSGWEILEKMKANPKTNTIPVLILTNLESKEDLERGLKMGADDYIVKAHFTPAEVLKKVEKYLNHHFGSNTNALQDSNSD